MNESVSLGKGKILSGYLFLGGSISLPFLGFVTGIESLKPNELIFFIVSLGGLLGWIISTTNLHLIGGHLYFQSSLQQTLESEYKSLEESKTNYYFRFLFFLGFLITAIFSIFNWGRNSYQIIFTQIFTESNLFALFIALYWILFIISALNWFKSFYSLRGKLLLIRFLIHTIKDNKGSNNLSADLKLLRDDLLEEYWKEGEYRMSQIISMCLLALQEDELPVNLKQYGFLYLDFKNLKHNKLELGHDIETLHDLFIKRNIVLERIKRMKNSSKISKADPRYNLKDIEMLLNDLEPFLRNWKIKNWDTFFETNLPWWLKLDVRSLRFLNKISILIETLRIRINRTANEGKKNE